MIQSNMKIKTKILLKRIVATTMVLSISMSNFFNIANAAISTNLPVSETRYNTENNALAFPESYRPYINSLKAAHPNWTFKAVYTNLDWNESIRHESYDVKLGISLVPASYSSNWKKDGTNHYMDGSFVIASKKAVEYTMDPRNFINETSIFQFEALDFHEETSKVATIEKVLAGTPMATFPTQYKRAGSMVNLENGLNWSQLIINSAKNVGGNGIGAVFLASRMRQETSLDLIDNGSINGSHSTYPGVYNFLNIRATPNSDGTGSVTNGLAYAAAESQSWTTPQKSIEGGAYELWSKYIRWGQNTMYFQKFDVNNPPKDPAKPELGGVASGLYMFQYMTNILAPSSEAKTAYNAYLNTGLLTAPFVFLIPVYDNMPDKVSPHPDSELTIPIITGTDIIYLDDTKQNGETDYFNIRSGPSTEHNIVTKIVEPQEGAENRRKFVRTQKGTNGWDKIRLDDNTEGYVSQAYVRDYNYTHVESIALDKTTANLKAEESLNLVASIAPTNAYIKNVTWSSSNPAVATVDNNGKVTAKSVGVANITVTTMDGNKTATCALTVDKTIATSIALSSSEYPLVVGKNLQINPIVLPETTTNKSYDISITDSTVAVVESGKIKGLKVGETQVILTTKDGSNKTYTFTLKVTESVSTTEGLTVDTNNIITKINLGTTATAIKDKVTTTYTKKLVSADNKELLDTDKVGTGTKVQIVNEGNVLEEYTIVIYGDISGDGLINSLDLFKMRDHMLGNNLLKDVYYKSANISKVDNDINSLDLFYLRQHMLNEKLIEQ